MDGGQVGISITQRRDSLRRAVRLSAKVRSRAWQNAATLTVTDVSEHGMWLRSNETLSIGEELAVSFQTPEPSGGSGTHVAALARVVRVAQSCGCALCVETAGMGVRFVALTDAHRLALQTALRGLPPPLPRAYCLPEPRVETASSAPREAACAQLTNQP